MRLSYFLRIKIDATVKAPYTIIFTVITLGPVGKSYTAAAKNPITKQTTEIIPDVTTTDLKLLHTRIAVIVGKTIKPDIIIAPTSCIPSTMVTAVSIAIKRL